MREQSRESGTPQEQMSLTDAVAPDGDMAASEGATEELDYSSTPDVAADDAVSEVPTESTEPPEDALFEVDGQWITLDEARNGYQRQADYTRKTQALAAERKQLEQIAALQAALDANPAATIRALQEVYGMADTEQDPNWDELDPTEQKVLEIDRKLQALEQERQLAAVDREIAEFQAAHADADVNSVMAFAVQQGFRNLEHAYRVMAFDEVAAKASAASQTQARVNAKRAAQVVSSDGTAKGGVGQEHAPKKFSSVREAFMAAAKEHGLDLDFS